MNKIKKNKAVEGFTLLEVLVAISIFSILLLITTNAFIRGLRTQRQASSLTYVNDNLSTLLEQMAREIRTGTSFCTGGTSCPSASVLSFVNASGRTVTYCLSGTSIERNVGNSCSPGSEVTGDNVVVDYLTFIISGNGGSDGYPPRITVLVGARPKDQTSSIFSVNMQTTVSSRIIGG